MNIMVNLPIKTRKYGIWQLLGLALKNPYNVPFLHKELKKKLRLHTGSFQ